jgi:hypothetical protein
MRTRVMKEISAWANSLLAYERKLKVAEPLCVYAILDPASSSKIIFFRGFGFLFHTMGQSSFYHSDNPTKNWAGSWVAPGFPMRQA